MTTILSARKRLKCFIFFPFSLFRPAEAKNGKHRKMVRRGGRDHPVFGCRPLRRAENVVHDSPGPARRAGGRAVRHPRKAPALADRRDGGISRIAVEVPGENGRPVSGGSQNLPGPGQIVQGRTASACTEPPAVRRCGPRATKFCGCFVRSRTAFGPPGGDSSMAPAAIGKEWRFPPPFEKRGGQHGSFHRKSKRAYRRPGEMSDLIDSAMAIFPDRFVEKHQVRPVRLDDFRDAIQTVLDFSRTGRPKGALMAGKPTDVAGRRPHFRRGIRQRGPRRRPGGGRRPDRGFPLGQKQAGKGPGIFQSAVFMPTPFLRSRIGADCIGPSAIWRG